MVRRLVEVKKVFCCLLVSEGARWSKETEIESSIDGMR